MLLLLLVQRPYRNDWRSDWKSWQSNCERVGSLILKPSTRRKKLQTILKDLPVGQSKMRELNNEYSKGLSAWALTGLGQDSFHRWIVLSSLLSSSSCSQWPSLFLPHLLPHNTLLLPFLPIPLPPQLCSPVCSFQSEAASFVDAHIISHELKSQNQSQNFGAGLVRKSQGGLSGEDLTLPPREVFSSCKSRCSPLSSDFPGILQAMSYSSAIL